MGVGDLNGVDEIHEILIVMTIEDVVEDQTVIGAVESDHGQVVVVDHVHAVERDHVRVVERDQIRTVERDHVVDQSRAVERNHVRAVEVDQNRAVERNHVRAAVVDQIRAVERDHVHAVERDHVRAVEIGRRGRNERRRVGGNSVRCFRTEALKDIVMIAVAVVMIEEDQTTEAPTKDQKPPDNYNNN